MSPLSLSRRTFSRFALPLSLAAAALSFSGCTSPAVHDPARVGPFYTPRNFAGDPTLPADMRRVVLFPVYGGNVTNPESTSALDPVFVTELQKQNRFEIVVLSREECLHRYRVPEISSTAALPHDFVEALRRDFGADGVMFIDLTAFKSYRPLVLGVRAKLASITGDSRLVWTFDNMFAASDPAVANSARRHFISSDPRGVPADLTPATLQSPAKFASYVAATTFSTLPPVYVPQPAATSANPR